MVNYFCNEAWSKLLPESNYSSKKTESLSPISRFSKRAVQNTDFFSYRSFSVPPGRFKLCPGEGRKWISVIICKTELLSASGDSLSSYLTTPKPSVWNQDKLGILQTGCKLKNPKMACDFKKILEESSFKKKNHSKNQNGSGGGGANKTKTHPQKKYHQQSVARPYQQCSSKQASKQQERVRKKLSSDCKLVVHNHMLMKRDQNYLK